MENYIIAQKEWDDEKFEALVDMTTLCACKNERNMGDERHGETPTNHWRVHLHIKGKVASISIDMSPMDGRKGAITVGYHRYNYTSQTVKHEDYKLRKGTTVQMIIDLINNTGLNKYEFTKEMEGCRWWVYRLVEELEEAKLIKKGCKDTMWSAVNLYYKHPVGMNPRDVKKGKFL